MCAGRSGPSYHKTGSKQPILRGDLHGCGGCRRGLAGQTAAPGTARWARPIGCNRGYLRLPGRRLPGRRSRSCRARFGRRRAARAVEAGAVVRGRDPDPADEAPPASARRRRTRTGARPSRPALASPRAAAWPPRAGPPRPPSPACSRWRCKGAGEVARAHGRRSASRSTRRSCSRLPPIHAFSSPNRPSPIALRYRARR